jgi:hypothetical protein
VAQDAGLAEDVGARGQGGLVDRLEADDALLVGPSGQQLAQGRRGNDLMPGAQLGQVAHHQLGRFGRGGRGLAGVEDEVGVVAGLAQAQQQLQDVGVVLEHGARLDEGVELGLRLGPQTEKHT